MWRDKRFHYNLFVWAKYEYLNSPVAGQYFESNPDFMVATINMAICHKQSKWKILWRTNMVTYLVSECSWNVVNRNKRKYWHALREVWRFHLGFHAEKQKYIFNNISLCFKVIPQYCIAHLYCARFSRH